MVLSPPPSSDLPTTLSLTTPREPPNEPSSPRSTPSPRLQNGPGAHFTMSAPALPIEILRCIFESAAYCPGEDAANEPPDAPRPIAFLQQTARLSLVCSTTRAWLLPILYNTVHIESRRDAASFMLGLGMRVEVVLDDKTSADLAEGFNGIGIGPGGYGFVAREREIGDAEPKRLLHLSTPARTLPVRNLSICLSPVYYPTSRTVACMLERLPILERLHVPLFFLPMIPPHLGPPSIFISKHGPFPLPGTVGYTVRDPTGVDWWTVKEDEMKEMRRALAKSSDIGKEVDAGLKAISPAGDDHGVPAYARDTRIHEAETLTGLDQFPINDLPNSPKDNLDNYETFLVMNRSWLPPVRRREVVGNCQWGRGDAEPAAEPSSASVRDIKPSWTTLPDLAPSHPLHAGALLPQPRIKNVYIEPFYAALYPMQFRSALKDIFCKAERLGILFVKGEEVVTRDLIGVFDSFLKMPTFKRAYIRMLGYGVTDAESSAASLRETCRGSTGVNDPRVRIAHADLADWSWKPADFALAVCEDINAAAITRSAWRRSFWACDVRGECDMWEHGERVAEGVLR